MNPGSLVGGTVRGANDRQTERFIASQALYLDSPATYRIRVQGTLGSDWSDRLGGMTITTVAREGEPPVSTLCGQLVDQAALLGVLNALYDWLLPLLSVECLEVQPRGSE
jgi:hypothetical protein